MRYGFVGLLWMVLVPSIVRAQDVEHPPGAYVEVLGHRIWVEREGEGEPLVLIPGGIGGSHDYYHPYFSALADSFQVIYYDGFGRGNSDRAASPTEYSFQHDVDEVEALRHALDLGPVNVLGHSYGGYVAEAYAIQHPASVRRLILSNTFVDAASYQESDDHLNGEIAQLMPELWQTVEKLREEGHLASSPALAEAYYGSFQQMLALFYFYQPSFAESIVFDEHTFNADEYYQIAGPDADFVVGGDMASLDFRDDLGTLTMPTLVIAGRGDGIVLPRLAYKFNEYMPQATFVTFEKSGHFPFIEQTAKLSAVLHAFLSDRPFR